MNRTPHSTTTAQTNTQTNARCLPDHHNSSQAKIEHRRRINREANERYRTKRWAEKGLAKQQHLPIPAPPTSTTTGDASQDSLFQEPNASYYPPPPPPPRQVVGPGASPPSSFHNAATPPAKRARTGTGPSSSLPVSSSPPSLLLVPPTPAGAGGSEGSEARRAAFADLIALGLQAAPPEGPARGRCHEAFALLWSREPAVFAAVEGFLAGSGAAAGMAAAAAAMEVRSSFWCV